MRRFVLIAITLLLACGVWAGTVTGRVFVDLNGDGTYQAGEAGVAGVLVSDGATLVRTAADGVYRLEMPDGEQVVFVENPAGTWATKGFYRNVKVGPAEADFPLVRQEQKVPFYFVQGTDLHIRPGVEPQMAQYVAAINGLAVPLAFVVHTGDLVADTNGSDVNEARKQFGLYKQMVAGLKPPLLNLPGNHEHVAANRKDIPPTTPGWGKGLYREVFGPTYYAFNYAGVHLVALDGSRFVNNKLAWDMSPECLEWLKAYLAQVPASEPLVLLIHEPFATLPGKAQIEEALKGRKVLLSLSGHGHGIARWTFAGAPEIMGGATSYAWHGSNFGANALGYHLVKITGDGVDSAFGDWAEKYPVTVLTPGRMAMPKGTIKVEALFLDLKNEVQSAEVGIGSALVKVPEIGTQGMYRKVTTELTVPPLPDGVHDLVITLHGQGEPFVERQPFVVLTGQQEPFTAAGPARLRTTVKSVQAPHAIRVNGREVVKLDPAAGEVQKVDVEIPAEALRRLNVVEMVSGPLAEGAGYDDCNAEFITLLYQGKVYRDCRINGVNLKKAAEAQTGTMYFDLTR
ncbi:MAG: metallophosphoesterase N-terminal domain-containing protein [Armatimonadia bacterium]